MAKGKKPGEIDVDSSYWFSRRHEFGDTVLRPKRKALGLTQSGIAERVGLTQSRICRIEDGARPRDLSTAQAIAVSYQLDTSETETWFQLFLEENDMSRLERRTFIKSLGVLPFFRPPGDVFQAVETPNNVDLLLEAYTDYAKIACEMRINGDPKRAIATITQLSDKLEQLTTIPLFSNDQPALYKILLELFYEQGWSYSETSSQHTNWAYKTGFYTKLQNLAVKYGEPRFSVLADTFLGDAFYVTEQYSRAIQQLQRALARETNDDHQLMILQTLAKIWARLNEKHRFSTVEAQIVQLIDQDQSLQVDHLSMTYASLARAQAFLGSQRAFRYLEEAKNVLVKIKSDEQKPPIATVQLIRNEFEVIRQLDPTGHYHFLRERGQEALIIATYCNYQRLTDRIQGLMASMDYEN